MCSSDLSPALSLLAKAWPTLQGRKIGVLISEGYELAIVDQLQAFAEAEGAVLELIGPHIGEIRSNSHIAIKPHHAIAGAPSVFFDSVVLAVSAEGVGIFRQQAAALNFIRDAFAHLKIIGFTAASMPLLDTAGIDIDDGIVEVETSEDTTVYIEAAKNGRFWPRAATIKA